VYQLFHLDFDGLFFITLDVPSFSANLLLILLFGLENNFSGQNFMFHDMC